MLQHKTHLLGIVLAAFALASSCNKEAADEGPVFGSRAISFSPAIHVNSTKADSDYIDGIITGSTLPTTSSFTSIIFYLPHDENGNPLFNKGGHFMSMFEPVRYDTEHNHWHTDAVHYWPLSGCCYFIAFYPEFAKLDSLHMRNSTQGWYGDRNQNFYIRDYTIKHYDESTKTDIEDDALKTDSNLEHAHVDLMSAKNLFEDVQDRKTGDAVPLEFTHGLTQIKFSVQTADDYSSYTDYKTIDGTTWKWLHFQQFWVDEIKLTNIYSKGDYSLSASPSHWPSDSLSELYTYYPLRQADRKGTEALYKVKGKNKSFTADSTYYANSIADLMLNYTRESAPTTIKEHGTGSDDLSILLIPQRIYSGAQLEIKYSTRVMNILTDGTYSGESHVMNDYTTTVTRTFNLSDITPLWIAGVCITFNLVISLDEISVTAEYQDWEDGNSKEIVN